MPSRDILIAGYLLMFAVWLSVVVVYQASSRGRWVRSSAGRLMMADAVLFVWLSGLVLSGVFFHNWPGRVWISISSVFLISLTGVWRLRLIVAAQRRRRAEYAQHVADAEALTRYDELNGQGAS
jgi:hypothetical protein